MEQLLVSTVRRYFEIELPRGHKRRKRWPMLIALHGYEGSKESMMRLARRIADGRMVVISLQGPNQFLVRGVGSYRVGYGWGTPEKMQDSIELHHRNIRALIRLASRKYRADLRRAFLLGFSQACSYNYRFVFTHPRAVRGVIAVCGGVPGDWSSNPRYRKASAHVLHIAATRDKWYPREKNLEMRRLLAQRAASVDFRFYNSIHRFPRPAIPHIRRWIEGLCSR